MLQILKGEVKDAFTNIEAGDITVGLYDSNQNHDSVVYKFTPDYYAKTKSDGSFQFFNLPPKKFTVFGFNDKNRNNVYDGESESVGFLDEKMNIISDTSFILNLFNEEPSKIFIRKNFIPYYGIGQIILNKKSKVKLMTLNPNDVANIREQRQGEEKDSISFFYKNLPDTFLLLLKNLSFEKIDTLKFINPRIKKLGKRNMISTNIKGNKLPLHQNLTLTFNNWMDTTFRTERKVSIQEKKDSLWKDVQLKGRWENLYTYVFTLPQAENKEYKIKMDTLIFKDIYGNWNDSLKAEFKTQSKTEFGNVILKLSFMTKQKYILQLMDERNNVFSQKYIGLSLSESNLKTIDFTEIPAGNYKVKVIYDDNDNGKWDTGNILKHKQPEHVFISGKQIKILSDWEIEEEIKVGK